MDDFISFLNAINFKITEGSEFCWKCFGPNARYLDSDSPTTESSVSCIFDSKTHVVYQADVYDERDDPETVNYTWVNPAYKEAYLQEHAERGILPFNENTVELELYSDALSKIAAVVNNTPIDRRITFEVDFGDVSLKNAFLAQAALQSMTPDEYVNVILLDYINSHNEKLAQEAK